MFHGAPVRSAAGLTGFPQPTYNIRVTYLLTYRENSLILGTAFEKSKFTP